MTISLSGSPTRYEAPFKAYDDWVAHQDRMKEIENLYPKRYPPLHRSPSPLRYRSKSPPKYYFDTSIHKQLGFDYWGNPKYVHETRPLKELFEPNVHVPISRFTRDPWWWDYPNLRPAELSHHYYPSSYYLRNSYLSPVKRSYLWNQHPLRPFSPHHVY